MYQCWTIVNWTFTNKLKSNFNRNSNIFIQNNALENAVCEIAFILSGPEYVNPIRTYYARWTISLSNLQAYFAWHNTWALFQYIDHQSRYRNHIMKWYRIIFVMHFPLLEGHLYIEDDPCSFMATGWQCLTLVTKFKLTAVIILLCDNVLYWDATVFTKQP